ncbi:MAG: hypothetical protein PHH44_01795 [bacterium]|nr:hypothetical protein [bacterium]
MKKALLVTFLIFNLITIAKVGSCEYTWHLFTSTPPIKGKVIDSVTGEPIKDAILVVRWFKAKPAIVDTADSVILEKGFITDSKGEFTIPNKINMHFTSWFAGMGIGVMHPSYSILVTGLSDERNSLFYADSEFKKGIIIATLKLTKLTDKYIKPEDNINLLEEFSEIFPKCYSLYFKWAKKLKVNTNKEAVFRNWDQIINRFPGAPKHLDLTIDIENEKSLINNIGNGE